jgi:hypothetical protein
MDMMTSALGFAGLAAYIRLRERNLVRASLYGHALCAAALFTHPNGLLATASICLCTLWLDLGRVSLRSLVATLMPYLAGGVGWGIYILRAPGDFGAQFGANAVDRGASLLHPWAGIRDEFVVRYLEQHFLPLDAGPVVWLKLTGLILFVASILFGLVIPHLSAQPGLRLLLALAGVRFLMMSVGDNPKFGYYLVHAVPVYAAIAGFVCAWFWFRSGLCRTFTAAVLGAYFVVQCAIFVHLIATVSAYRRQYMPAVAYVRSILRPTDLVVGPRNLRFLWDFIIRN